MTRQKSSAEYGRIQQNTHVFSYYSSYFIRILVVFYSVFCTVFYPYFVEYTEYKRFSYSMLYSCCILAVFFPYSINEKNTVKNTGRIQQEYGKNTRSKFSVQNGPQEYGVEYG